MGRRAITNELYDKLLESFRKYPGEYARAGRHAGCTPQTASKAWRVGWPRQNRQWTPIEQLFEAEKVQARALVAESSLHVAEQLKSQESVKHQAQREKAAADALESRGQEAQMIRLLRADVTQTLASVARMLPEMQNWAKWCAKEMGENNPTSIGQAVRLLGTLSKVTERIAGAADRVMAMERRLLGQPEMMVGVIMPEITLEEAIEHIEAGARTLEYARDAGLLPPAETVDCVDAELVTGYVPTGLAAAG